MTPFTRKVHAIVRRIPPGFVSTYGDVARLAGKPRAHRAVGTIMRHVEDVSLPCHRVIGAGGRLGGFGSHPQAKSDRLRAEGIVVRNGRVRGFEAIRWRPRANLVRRRSV